MNQRGVSGCDPRDEKMNTTKHIESPTIGLKASQDRKNRKKGKERADLPWRV